MGELPTYEEPLTFGEDVLDLLGIGPIPAQHREKYAKRVVSWVLRRYLSLDALGICGTADAIAETPLAEKWSREARSLRGQEIKRLRGEIEVLEAAND